MTDAPQDAPSPPIWSGSPAAAAAISPTFSSGISPGAEFDPAVPKLLYYSARQQTENDPEATIRLASQAIEVLIAQYQRLVTSGEEARQEEALLKAALALRGNTYKKLNRYLDAEGDFTQWIGMFDSDAVAYSKRAAILFLKNDFHACIVDYKTALRLKLEEKEKMDVVVAEQEAIRTGGLRTGPAAPNKEAKESSADLAEYFYNIGLSYKNLGCYTSAVHWFSQALTYKPSFRLASQNLKLVRLLKSVKSQDLLLREIRKLELKDDDSTDKKANKLNLIRTLVHSYLSSATARALRSHTIPNHSNVHHYSQTSQQDAYVAPMVSKPFARPSGGSSSPSSSRSTPTPTLDDDPNAVVLAITSELVCFLTGDANVDLARFIEDPAMRSGVQKRTDVTLSQSLNYVADFAMNFSQLPIFRSAQQSEQVTWKQMAIDEEAEERKDEGERFDLANSRELSASSEKIARAMSNSAYSDASKSDEGPPKAGEEHHEHEELAALVPNHSITKPPEDGEAHPDHGKQLVHHDELWSAFTPQLLGCTVDSLLTNRQIQLLHESLPALYQGHDFQLAYSTRQHGTSLQSLYRQCGWVGANIMVIMDERGRIFGGFSSQSWDPSTTKHYQGTGETYVFSFAYPDFKFWRWSELNEYYLLARHEMICFGGGGRFALHIDSELASGSTGPCETFNSPTLIPEEEDFDIMAIEVWYFPGMQDGDEKARDFLRLGKTSCI